MELKRLEDELSREPDPEKFMAIWAQIATLRGIQDDTVDVDTSEDS